MGGGEMGKKRKVKEIAEEDRIQTILVRDPYGYHQNDTWDAEDAKRNDNGLYVAVEWLEFIFGGLGPSSLQIQRTRGPAVEAVWTWNGRTDLLVAIRRDIDLNLQLGIHPLARFLRNSPRGPSDTRRASIRRDNYESEDQIVGMGQGWKLASPIPFVEVPSIRKHKFVEPYPSPGGSTDLQRISNPVKNEDSKNVKPQVKHEPNATGVVKRELKTEDPMSTGSAIAIDGGINVKPSLLQSHADLSTALKPDSGRSNEILDILSRVDPPRHLQSSPSLKAEPTDTSVKEEDVDDMIRRAQARRQEDRRAALAIASNSGTSNSIPAQTSQRETSLVAPAGADENIKPRPTKRVKKVEPY